MDSDGIKEEDLYLGFVRLIGQEIDDYYSYEFIFTTNPESLWGVDFEHKPCGLCNNIFPDDKYVDRLIKVKMMMQLDLIQDSLCFGFQDCIDHCVAIAYENIDMYDDYPDDGRLVLNYGDSYYDVEKKLAKKKVFLD